MKRNETKRNASVQCYPKFEMKEKKEDGRRREEWKKTPARQPSAGYAELAVEEKRIGRKGWREGGGREEDVNDQHMLYVDSPLRTGSPENQI